MTEPFDKVDERAFLLFHAVEQDGAERFGITVDLPGFETPGINTSGVMLDRHGTVSVLQQHEVEQLPAGPAVAVHEWMDVFEHRMERRGLEQRVRVASVQPVDQGLQVVMDLQRVGGLDAGRGDSRQISVRTERAACERLQVQCGHLVDPLDQFRVEFTSFGGVFADVGHAVGDAARREHETCRGIRGHEFAFQYEGCVLKSQGRSFDGV